MSFIIYGDFDSILKSATDNNDAGRNTKIYQNHIACSHKLVCVD